MTRGWTARTLAPEIVRRVPVPGSAQRLIDVGGGHGRYAAARGAASDRRNLIHRRRWHLCSPGGQVFRDDHEVLKAHRALFHRPPMPLEAA
jgi:hypothetical protein